MSFQFIRDDFSQIKEEGFKTPKRKASNFITQNSMKNSLIIKNSPRLNKSITKLRMKRKKTKNEANIIKDYLHYHKFGLQRNEGRKVTIKVIKKNSNDSFMSNKRNPNECNSMIYYPEEKKNKKIETKIYDLKKEPAQKTNLKKIESILFNKLNNMKFNFNQNEILKDIDNDNNSNNGNIFELKNCENPNSYRSAKNNIKLNNSYYKNKFKGKKNKSITSSCFRQNSTNANLNNIKNVFFPNIKENEEKHKNKSENIKKEILQFPKEKSIEDSDKIFLTLKDANQKFQNKASSKSINMNFILKEKSRILRRIKPVYDSFDDDESDKEDEINSSILLPSSPIIFLLDIFLFVSSFYSSFYIPLKMAKEDCFCSDEHRVNKILLYFIDILYIIDFCISFFRAYYNYELKLVKRNINIIFHI